MYDQVVPALLECNASSKEIVQWFEASGSVVSECIQRSIDPDIIDLVRPEIPLLLLNFIRNQSSRILHVNTTCLQTPSKAPFPSQYEYKSPIKAAKGNTTKLAACEKNTKKRTQLFTSANDSPSTWPIELSSSTSELPETNEKRLLCLEERLTAEFPPGPSAGSTKNKVVGRRSLDSNPKVKGLTLLDFLSPTFQGHDPKSSKPQKSRASRGRRSDSALLSGAKNTDEGKIKMDKSGSAFLAQDHQPGAKNSEEEKMKMDKSGSAFLAQDHQSSTENTEETQIQGDVFENIKTEGLMNAEQPTLSPQCPPNDLVEPDPTKATCIESLNKLVDLYSYCINEHLVPNVLVEMYLILELFTIKAAKHSDEAPSEEGTSHYFHSIHNCFYFASEMLKRHYYLLRFTDRLTLKYMVENRRLGHFCPDVKSQLALFFREDSRQLDPDSSQPGLTPTLQSVRFETETDAKGSFPSLAAFQDFRKQRDLFYQIFRDWQRGPGTSRTHFAANINRLICLQLHPVNMAHLAKLFQEQLLATALLEVSKDVPEEPTEEDLGILGKHGKDIDSVKWRRLQARLVTPSPFSGPCPAPTFRGVEEFFSNFICSAGGYHTFLTYLKITFVDTIVELDMKEFDMDYSLADEERFSCMMSNGELLCAILKLRVLAKFLGLIEALPYTYANSSFGGQIWSSELFKSRQAHTPSIDLIQHLETSRLKMRLILTVPWIVEFCSMLDPTSMRLPYYHRLFRLLLSVYQQDIKIKERSVSDPALDTYRVNSFFLSIQLGWLFESIHFPRELFLVSSMPHKSGATRSPPASGLDRRVTVSGRILYTCCPYLSGLTVILSQFHTDSKAARVVSTVAQALDRVNAFPAEHDHHAAAAAAPEAQKHAAEKRDKKTYPELQLELETNFFHNQPASVKKTVDFVSERLASNVTRIVTQDLVPCEVNRVTKLIKGQVRTACARTSAPPSKAGSKSVASGAAKKELLSLLSHFAEESCAKVKQQALHELRAHVSKIDLITMGPLLPSDTSPSLAQMCLNLTRKRAVLQCRQWINQHVCRDFFCKEYSREADRLLCKSMAASQGISQVAKPRDQNAELPAHDEATHQSHEDDPIWETLSCDLLIKIKDESLSLLTSKGFFTVQPAAVADTLRQLRETLAREAHFYATCGSVGHMDMTLRGVDSLSIYWIIALCAFSPEALDADVMDEFIGLWGLARSDRNQKAYSMAQPPAQLMSLLSPRNLTIISQSRSPSQTWTKIETLITRLLKCKLLVPLALEDQCIQILRKEWPQDLLRRLASCLNGVACSDPAEISQSFIDWISWLCSQLADEHDDVDSVLPL